MGKVYIVIEHYYEDTEVIGVFSTMEPAKKCVEARPERFRYIVEHELDKQESEA